MTEKRGKKRLVLPFLFGLLAVGMLPACQTDANSERAPNFTLLDLDGEIVRLSDFGGRVVLLNFFATYCQPCRYEIPDFLRLKERYEQQGFIPIGISVDQNGPIVLPGFIKALSIDYPVLLATSKVLADYGDVYALPASFLIGRDGQIIQKYTGMVTEDEIEPLIVKALGAEK